MKSLKFLAPAIFAVILILASGCGNSDKKSDEQRIGMLTHLNSTEAQMSNSTEKVTYYENLSSMVMALSSKVIDQIQTYASVAKYVTGKNSDLKVSNTTNLLDEFSCALRDDEEDLRNEFDSAVVAMKNDGTLENLIQTYITNANPNPASIEPEKFDGAETIKVGVTGDLPPIDLITADGKPAGFNTAVISEIGKRIQKNIEFVQIDSAARAAALASKKVDVVFWIAVPADDSNRPKNMDTPENILVTTPYYQDAVVDVNLSGAFGEMN